MSRSLLKVSLTCARIYSLIHTQPKAIDNRVGAEEILDMNDYHCPCFINNLSSIIVIVLPLISHCFLKSLDEILSCSSPSFPPVLRLLLNCTSFRQRTLGSCLFAYTTHLLLLMPRGWKEMEHKNSQQSRQTSLQAQISWEPTGLQ